MTCLIYFRWGWDCGPWDIVRCWGSSGRADRHVKTGLLFTLRMMELC